MIFPCYENFDFTVLWPERSNMKANCLQISSLGALTSVQMWNTRGKNLTQSWREPREKLGQESNRKHPLICLDAKMSWVDLEQIQNLGTHTRQNTPRRCFWESWGPGGVFTAPLSPCQPPSGEKLGTQPTGTPFFFALWVRSLQKLQMTVLIVVRVIALETVQKNTTQK